MTDYTELVRKMRTCLGDKKCFEKECRYWSELGCMDGNICCDAAAAIEELIESVHIRDKHLDELNHYIWKLEAEVKQLKDANDELREAQTYIDHYGDKWMVSAKDVPTSAYNHGYMDGKNEAEQALEPKLGEWLNVTDSYHWYGKCSVCGEEFVVDAYYAGGMNYCPNCGAKMEAQE